MTPAYYFPGRFFAAQHWPTGQTTTPTGTRGTIIGSPILNDRRIIQAARRAA